MTRHKNLTPKQRDKIINIFEQGEDNRSKIIAEKVNIPVYMVDSALAKKYNKPNSYD